MKKLLFFAAAVAFAALTSCSGGGSKDNATDSTKTKDGSETAATGNGKYKLKSGIIEQTSSTMGMKQNITVYFDDYGSKECTETKSEMDMGIAGKIKIHNISLMKDGYMYSIDMTNKSGTKTKVGSMGGKKEIDFSAMTEDMMKQMKITKLGTEVLLGKTCDKYSMDDAALGMKGTYSVWEGIPLKSEVDMAGIKATITTTKIDENATVPAEKFEVPAGIKITDMDKKGE
jgi:hypothetical protein